MKLIKENQYKNDSPSFVFVFVFTPLSSRPSAPTIVEPRIESQQFNRDALQHFDTKTFFRRTLLFSLHPVFSFLFLLQRNKEKIEKVRRDMGAFPCP